MKISLAWLKEIVDIPWSVEETADKLTLLGFQVEGITYTGVKLDNIIAVQIQSIEKHPNADRLQIAKVYDGKNERTIVCGAPNIAVEQVVPLALPGTKLGDQFEIKVTKIRGIESEGMLCSERELGLSDNHAGIFQLPIKSQLGAMVNDIIGGEDVIFDIEVTPNRPDNLSHIGIARELAALTGKKLHFHKSQWKTHKIGPKCKIIIKEPKMCHRYLGKIFLDVKVGPSPQWMVQRLNTCGIRSINNIVDITNYVLLEWGHPLHSFDLEKCNGQEIVVRMAKEGESILALDEKKYPLLKEDLIIADRKDPIAIAGIMGGQLSGVTETTTKILLESAIFDPATVRKTSKRLNLKSESSYRFERGTDSETAQQASLRAAHLLMELANGQPGQASDVFPTKPKKIVISMDRQKMHDLLGIKVDDSKVDKIFKNLGFSSVKSKMGWKCQIPSFRKDLFEDADLIEEIARHIGYDNIPETLPRLNPGQIPADQEPINQKTLTTYLKGQGLNETITSSFSSSELIQKLGTAENRWIKILNPVSQEETILRPTLLANLLKAVTRNIHYQRDTIRLFEWGKTYQKNEQNLALEEQKMALVLYGNSLTSHWSKKNDVYDFFDLKGLLEGIASLSDQQIILKNLPTNPLSYYAPHQSFGIMRENAIIGYAGALHPALAKEFDFKYPCYMAEWILNPTGRKHPFIRPLPRFPFVERDLAIVVEKNKNWVEIEQVVRQSENRFLDAVYPFDIFMGGSLKPHQKSIAFRVRLNSIERTLSDVEINGTIEKIKDGLKKRIGAELR
ncbi:phenylalanine--tRNA ligase subunit beta [bacterium F11]|nr:phenylalanine--tRNA ligase subunit beta [bacterium F11]